MAEPGEGIYVSRVDPGDWKPDLDIGGQAHMLFEEPDGSTVGLWRSDPAEPSGPADAVEIPLRETILVLQGSVRIGIDDREPLELGEGEIVSIPKGSMVAWDPTPDCKVFWVYS
jgi:uncharacterized cupin superfamily protein